MKVQTSRGLGMMLLLSLVAICFGAVGIAVGADDGIQRNRLLPPGPGNPRNGEGDFIKLKDGRVLFVYTHFTGDGSDHAAAHLAGRFSSDGGRTWTGEDVVVVPNEGGQNVMSVSLLRLQDGRIGLFYLRKNSITDCRPCMRISTDEAKTWGEPTLCINDQIGYYVLNNDRAVQLKSGRIVLPVALHNTPEYKKPDWAGTIMCYLSDDNGKSWRCGKDQFIAQSPQGKRVMAQEPGVVELKDGRLMMFMRGNGGSQYVCHSADGGDTWSAPGPSNIISPRSPASIKRIPKTGDLILVWNNHQGLDEARRRGRTPLTVALSRDEGKTWEKIKNLEDDPKGSYCYTAISFLDDHVLLAYYTRGTQITRFDLDWLYR